MNPELSNVSFEKLLKLQETIKTKSKPEKASSSRLQKQQKQVDKSAPVIQSSKLQTSRRRQVVSIAPRQIRDPRFDASSGVFRKDAFEKSYKFLNELEKQEHVIIQDKILKTTDSNERDQLMKLQERLNSKLIQKKADEEKQKVLKDWKKSEMQKVQQGKKPFFLKQTEIKKRVLVQKFNDLKTNDVDKLLAKRRKHNAAKERKRMPKR